MTEMPKLTIGYNDHGYAIAGWDEFNRYALRHWPTWKSTWQDTSTMQETDRLKMMLAAHAVELERIKKVYAEYCARNPEREIQVDGKTYRYVGP